MYIYTPCNTIFVFRVIHIQLNQRFGSSPPPAFDHGAAAFLKSSVFFPLLGKSWMNSLDCLIFRHSWGYFVYILTSQKDIFRPINGGLKGTTCRNGGVSNAMSGYLRLVV